MADPLSQNVQVIFLVNTPTFKKLEAARKKTDETRSAFMRNLLLRELDRRAIND